MANIWTHVLDPDYCGGGYTECSACGWRLSDGAYHEVYEFQYCPHCGARMAVEEDLVEVVRCKDCIEYYAGMEKPICTLLGLPTEADFFCAEGRDKEHDQERRAHQAHRQV